ncbi:MAG TPA: histidine kinase [Puia sp.]|nr:histidine kinase [Puia sp.]
MPAKNNHSERLPRPWVYHSVFWLAYYIFAALISFSIHHIVDPRFYWQLLTLVPPDMALVYLHLFLLRRFLLDKRNIAAYVVLILAGMSLIAFVNISVHGFYARLGSTSYAASGVFTTSNFAAQILNCIYLLGLATAAKFAKDWMLQKQQLQEIAKTQVATELAFLRSQIQPHFFFNTLNNLYSLTLQRSDRAPDVVLKLSSVMSYMLYESGAPLVPLEKEIGNLENYMALEQLRFGGRLSLSFEKKGAMESVRIPPLLLLVFVENSFKHGMSQIAGQGCIHLLLQVDPGELLFHIDNPVGNGRPLDNAKAGPGGQIAGDDPQGIGLKNAIRRLDLLYGPRYQLDLREAANTFHVTLKIPLP